MTYRIPATHTPVSMRSRSWGVISAVSDSLGKRGVKLDKASIRKARAKSLHLLNRGFHMQDVCEIVLAEYDDV